MTSRPDALEEMRAALEECAATFDSGPCTVSQGHQLLAVEFQRRMNIAAKALASAEENATPQPERVTAAMVEAAAMAYLERLYPDERNLASTQEFLADIRATLEAALSIAEGEGGR